MIKTIVSRLIKTYGTNNPFELCDFLGIKIMKSDLGNEIKGFFQRTANGYSIVHLNNNLNNNEIKYVCSHELGHAVIHPDLSIRFFMINKLQVKTKYEIQADKFAAELLLPNRLDCEYKNMNVSQLSSCFSVPKELINYRYRRESIYE
ncbi:ImmA/IrrE family metallo-endopeptidase [Clostridium coskatii]|uniref:Metallopeptidase ImmA n=1 Tax=Clostridium coskatii TaxID=1705578 RepID=A0A166T180_9CLOT|nr:ImmA/IrrE family metallo-endopeptidase [Clostridium coskatii]OAA93048.1 Metallopeptidase ImmA [Clostridium coskatii]OBR90791.1 metallopeptidase ImmA [Clostridium coskatii]